MTININTDYKKKSSSTRTVICTLDILFVIGDAVHLHAFSWIPALQKKEAHFAYRWVQTKHVYTVTTLDSVFPSRLKSLILNKSEDRL